MKRLTLLAVIAALFVSAVLPAQAQSPNYSKITYIHSDADGSPFAATDEQGNLEWHIDHYPYGDEYRNTEVARKSNLSFAGKAYDEEIGLSYFGGRWHDPAAGRFMSIDPAPVDPEDYRTFNRYAYGFNNPYKYVDPDGNLPILIPLAIFIAKEIAAEGASRATGGLTDFLSFRRTGTKALKYVAKKLRRKKCCFVAGTQVLTESGYKNIESVELGEKLWAKNVETGEQDWKPVTKVFIEPDRAIYRIDLLTGEGLKQKIEATDDHPFYVIGKGWTPTIELVAGDQIETSEGVAIKVVAVTDEQRQDLTYNFTIADFNTFYVTQRNVLVHNCDKSVSRGTVPKPTRHSVNQKINREVKSSDELDAIKNPLDKRPVKTDSLGRPSQRSVGERAEIAINPDTNKIVSVNPTSTKKVERLKRRNLNNGGG